MRKIVIGLVTSALLGSSLPAIASAAPEANLAIPASDAPEACLAVNPGMPTCTLTITSDSGGTPTGWEGVGDWKVEVKRGKKTYRFKSNGDPVWGHSFTFNVGDVLKATATTPGSSILAGHTS